MNRRRFGALALAALAGGCRAARMPTLDELTIATGQDGGVYDTLGAAMAAAAQDRWHVPAAARRTGGAVENLLMIEAGEADLAFTTIDVAAVALRGQPPFSGPVRMLALAGLYEDDVQVVTLAGGPVHGLTDLRGQRVCVGAKGSGTRFVADRILTAAGLRAAVEELTMDIKTATDALRDGALAAFWFTSGLPAPAVAELASQTRIDLLPVDVRPDLLDGGDDLYHARTVPAGSYGLAAPVPSIGIPNILVVRADLPASAAHELTALIFQAKPALVAAHPDAHGLDRRSALATYPVPLHPGAGQYYRDTKVMVGS